MRRSLSAVTLALALLFSLSALGSGFPLEPLQSDGTPLGFKLATNGQTFLAGWTVAGASSSSAVIVPLDANGARSGNPTIIPDASLDTLFSTGGTFGAVIGDAAASSTGPAHSYYLRLTASGAVASRTQLAAAGPYLAVSNDRQTIISGSASYVIDAGGNVSTPAAIAPIPFGSDWVNVRTDAYSVIVERVSTAGERSLVYAYTRPAEYQFAPATVLPAPGGVLVVFNAATKSASFFVRSDGTVTPLHEYPKNPFTGTIVRAGNGYRVIDTFSRNAVHAPRLDANFVPLESGTTAYAVQPYSDGAAVVQNDAGTVVMAPMHKTNVAGIGALTIDPDTLAEKNFAPLVFEAPVQSAPRVASNGATFLTVWTDNVFGATAVKGRLLDAGGQPASQPFAIGSAASATSEAAVAWNGSSYLVAWTDGSTVRVLRLTSGGTAIDAAPATFDSAATDLRIAGNAAGFLIVWNSNGVIRGASVGANGASSPVRELARANGLPNADGFTQPRVATDGVNFLVTFATSAFGSAFQTWATRVATDATTITAPVLISADRTTLDIASSGSEFMLLLAYIDYGSPLPWSNIEMLPTGGFVELSAASVPATAATPAITRRTPILTIPAFVSDASLSWSRGSYLAVAGALGIETIRFARSGNLLERRYASDAFQPEHLDSASNTATDVATFLPISPGQPRQAFAWTLGDMPLAPAIPPAPVITGSSRNGNTLTVTFTPPLNAVGVELDWWDGHNWIGFANEGAAPSDGEITGFIPSVLIPGSRFRLVFWNVSGMSSTELTIPARARAARH